MFESPDIRPSGKPDISAAIEGAMKHSHQAHGSGCGNAMGLCRTEAPIVQLPK